MTGSRSKSIFIHGMCSLPLGTMERQLGNMAIFIPMLSSLKRDFPGYNLKTSLQLSDKFCTVHDIESLDIPSFWRPTLLSGLIAIFDYMRSLAFRLLAFLKLEARFLLAGKKFQVIINSSVIIDFSGDTFGFMGHPLHLINMSVEILTFRNLNKKYVIYAASPGPFPDIFRRVIAKTILNRTNAICVREPVTYARSGMLHAAVAEYSSCIPTVTIAYGAKFYGFAKSGKRKRLVSNASGGRIEARDIILKFDHAVSCRQQIQSELSVVLPTVEELVSKHKKVLQTFLD